MSRRRRRWFRAGAFRRSHREVTMSLTAADTTSTRSPASAIAELVEPWTRACLARDWDALLGLCTDDVAFSPPHEPLVEGQAVRPWLGSFPPVTSRAWDIGHVEGDGDLAWLRGPVSMTVDVAGQAVAFDGKYTDVCRRAADGTWRFAHVMWSSNEPAPG